MSNNLKIWNSVKQAPNEFLKRIEFGYLKGKSDINPQWRLMAMTQAFGPVGHGWTYRIVRTWSETAPCGTMMAFAEVAVKTKYEGEWGEEFFGIGGSQIAELAKGNIKANDEGYKMAVTDALSVAFKAVGVAADIYLGNYDGSKYKRDLSEAFVDFAEMFEAAKKEIPKVTDVPQLGVIYKKFAQTQYKDEITALCAERKKELENA